MMDYKKKYNEALERAKRKYGKFSEFVTKIIEEIFPELRESEDERIRKNLISFLEALYAKGKSAWDGGQWSKSDCADWISYLEKQKEQKPEIKYVYPKFRKGDVIEPITPNGHFTPVRVVDIYDGSYYCRSDDNKAYLSLSIKQEDEYRLAEQKPAWSEEDEKMLQLLLRDYECPMQSSRAIWGEDFKKKYNWLKFLRPPLKLSEDQIYTLERICSNLHLRASDDAPKLDEIIEILKRK